MTDILEKLPTYDRPFYEPIGEYVFQFGYLERDIDWCVTALLGLQYIGQGDILFSQVQSLPARLRLISVLAASKTKVKELVEELDELILSVGKQNTFRNSLVHGAWNSFHYTEGKEAEGAWQKIHINKNSLKRNVFEISARQIRENRKAILTYGAQMMNLVQTILNTPDYPFAQPPSPDKSA